MPLTCLYVALDLVKSELFYHLLYIIDEHWPNVVSICRWSSVKIPWETFLRMHSLVDPECICGAKLEIM